MQFETAKNQIKRLLIFCLCCFCFVSFLFTVNASETASADELLRGVSFRFSVVDRQFSFVVTNNTPLDIVSFRTYDYQRNDDTEKGGATDMRRYPVVDNGEPAVPAGKTVEFTPSPKVMWKDCNNVVVYVYSITFSDGTVWGTESPAFPDVYDYALRFDVPFEYSTPAATAAIQNQSEPAGTSKDNTVRNTVLFAVLLGGIIAVVIYDRVRAFKKRSVVSRSSSEGNISPKGNLSPERKGRIGEYQAYAQLDQIPGEKRLLHNLYIPKADGTKTEIDCLFIHQNGLFVIESKNYKGYIYGSAADKKWTQVLRRNKHFTFYNPVMQNAGHIRNLKTYLSYQMQDKYRDLPVYSVVVFTPSADISKVNTQGLPNNAKVVYTQQIVDAVSSFIGTEAAPICTALNVLEIYNTLYPLTRVTEEEKQKHAASVKSEQ